jgi:hypothetical protein
VDRRRPLRRTAWSLGLAAVVIGALTAAPSAATPIVARYTLAPNLKLTTTRATEPLEIRKLVWTPGGSTAPDIGPASSRYPMYTLTSKMSSAAGAIVGVNGDFGTSARQPAHVLMVDGELWTTGELRGNAIAWSENGRTMYIGRPRLGIRAVKPSGAPLFQIDEWNAHLPTNSTVAGYTSRGGAVTVPPGVGSPTTQDPVWCEARLEPSSGAHWSGTTRKSIVRSYVVTVQPDPCERTSLPVGTTAGAVVLATAYTSSVSNPVQNLSVGTTVKLRWTLAGWPGATDVMGGGQMLVEKGVNVAPPYVSGSPHILDYNPRTGVGIRRGCSDLDPVTVCRLILETVDGRQASTGWSVGVRLPWLADSLLHAGAWMALNLDGGGSTTMWTSKTDPQYCQSFPTIGGCLVQRPSQPTGERATRSAIVILPSADTGAPSGLR